MVLMMRRRWWISLLYVCGLMRVGHQSSPVARKGKLFLHLESNPDQQACICPIRPCYCPPSAAPTKGNGSDRHLTINVMDR